MGQVNVTISGRQYRMACEDGQEDHLSGLAQDIDGRITRLRKAFGEIGDQRLTMMVAIMVADELHEASRSVDALKAEARRAARGARQRRRAGGGARAHRGRGGAGRRPAHREAGAEHRHRPAQRAGAGLRMAASPGKSRALSRGGGKIGGKAFLFAGLVPTLMRRGCEVRPGDTYPRGLIDPNGSCPCPDPWVRANGAHLQCRFPGIDTPTAIAAPHRPPMSLLPALEKQRLRRAALERRAALGDAGRRRAAEAVVPGGLDLAARPPGAGPSPCS